MRPSISASSTTSSASAAGRPSAPRGWSTRSRSPARNFPGAKHSLDALCTRFGVDRSQRIKHGALLDAQLLAQVYVELTGGRQIGLGLVAELIEPDSPPGEDPGHDPLTIVAIVRPPRPHAPSEEELARHAAFLATIKDPIWNRL